MLLKIKKTYHRESIYFETGNDRTVDVNEFNYTLPPEKIAAFPLKERDQSKLLVYDRGDIKHAVFRSVPDFLPANAFLFFNNTRVIPARIHFKKQTGADIEVFLLSPVSPSNLLTITMLSRNQCSWICTIGNLKRWPDHLVLSKNLKVGLLQAKITNRDQGIVEFSWNNNLTFAELVDEVGQTPLPPYLNRPAVEEDRSSYQTIYSDKDGAVAAPTAGLHFTSRVFDSLEEKNIGHDFLTLHVSAGTFQPIKTRNVAEHPMHKEQIIVTKSNIENLLIRDRMIIPVGTTSMRTIESLYWYGTKLLHDNKNFEVLQDAPYTEKSQPPVAEALAAILHFMDLNAVESLTGETSIFIRPGYRFKICKGLITNFHQPGSTLILLVAAFIGEDWRKLYDEALRRDYRFLSYGDSSLLFPRS